MALKTFYCIQMGSAKPLFLNTDRPMWTTNAQDATLFLEHKDALDFMATNCIHEDQPSAEVGIRILSLHSIPPQFA